MAENVVTTRWDVLALDGETPFGRTGQQFVVWDSIQEKWMIGEGEFVPNARFTYAIELGEPE